MDWLQTLIERYRTNWTRINRIVLAIALGAFILSLTKVVQLNDIRSYNTDLLYIPTLFKDITEWGGRLLEWRLPPSPYFFPDMLLYFPIALTVSNFHSALLIYGLLQVILFTAGWSLLGKYFFESKEKLLVYISFVLVTIAIFLLLVPRVAAILWPQFTISIHFGVMLVLPYVLSFTLQILKNDSFSIYPYLGLSVTLIFITLSDIIAIPQLTIPILVALLFLLLLRKVSLRKALSLFACIVISLMAAYLLRQLLIQYPALHANATPLVERMGNSLTELGKTAIRYWRSSNRLTLILLFTAILVHLSACLAAIYFASAQRNFNYKFVFFSAFILASIVLSIIAGVGTGLFLDLGGMRYLYPATFLIVYSLLPYFFLVLDELRISQLFVLLTSTIVIGSSLSLFSDIHRFGKYADHYPELVSCIDAATSQRDVQVGVGEYWDAKYVSILSKNEVMILQARPDFSPDIWINNPQWYARYRPKFILFDPQETKLQLELIINRYGYPQEIVSCPDRELWFYNRPEDLYFQTFFADHPLIPNWCHSTVSRDIPAYVWRGEEGINVGSSLVAKDQEGIVSAGHLPQLPDGDYALTLTYRYEGGNHAETIGEFEVGVMPIGGDAESIQWTRKPLRIDMQSETIKFNLPEQKNIFAHVYFKGEGTITIEQYRLEKIIGGGCY
jgi:hypothetical protein